MQSNSRKNAASGCERIVMKLISSSGMKKLSLVVILSWATLSCVSCSSLQGDVASWDPLDLFGTQSIDPNMPEKKAFADVNAARDNYKKAIEGRENKKTAYFQPVNKTEKCLAPNIDFENEFPASPTLYWDGECSDGYASGLGRIITVVGDNHYESIIDLKNSTSIDAGSFPLIYRNFREKLVFRGILTPDSSYGIFERAAWDEGEKKGFYVVTRAFNSFDQEYSEFTFHSLTTVIAKEFGVQYKRTFNTQAKEGSPSVSDIASPDTMIGFPASRKDLLYNPARYRINGRYQTAIVQHGQKYPFRIIGQENWRQFDQAIRDAVSHIDRLNMVLDREVIQGLEGRYDAKLAGEATAPKGIDPNLYFAINSYYPKDVNSRVFEVPANTQEAIVVRSKVGQVVWDEAVRSANALREAWPLARE